MSLLNDITLQALLSRLVAFIVITAIHGFVVAGTARLLGDPTPAYAGRLTLNPFVHLSMPALAMAVLFRLGWIVPMPIDATKLRFGRWGLLICLLAGLVAVLALVPILWPVRSLVATYLPRTTGLAVLGVLDTIQDLAIWFSAFNILPIPPLSGALILIAIWPPLARRFRRSRGLIEAIMVVLVVIGAATIVVMPIVNIVQGMIAGT